MIDFLYVALGGAFGAVLRYWVKISINTSFPYGTLLVNLLGCLLMGICAGTLKSCIKPLVCVGFLGAFTTFSSFGIEIVDMFTKNQIGLALLNILLNNVLGIGFAFLGYYVGSLIAK